MIRDIIKALSICNSKGKSCIPSSIVQVFFEQVLAKIAARQNAKNIDLALVIALDITKCHNTEKAVLDKIVGRTSNPRIVIAAISNHNFLILSCLIIWPGILLAATKYS